MKKVAESKRKNIINITFINIFKYHVFAPMGIFQLKLIYLYFPLSFHLLDGRTVENKGKLILNTFTI